MASSMSVMDPTPSSYARIASSKYGTSSRFTMNPVLSLVRTGTLPSFTANSYAVSYTSGAVAMVFTTSTIFIMGTGLKKCRPMKRSGRLVAVINSGTEIDEETLSSKRTVDANKRGQYDFEHSPEGFIANVNIFGEGIDAPCVDCVIFADPMQSKDAIAQKVGRGWRYDPANPDAKLIVIVPVLLDKDGIDGTDPKKFKTILEVLGAIGSLDKTLEVEINEVASNLPCDGGDQIFIVEGDIPVVDLVRLRKTITTSVYSGASLSWWQRYNTLKFYLEMYGEYPSHTSSLGR